MQHQAEYTTRDAGLVFRVPYTPIPYLYRKRGQICVFSHRKSTTLSPFSVYFTYYTPQVGNYRLGPIDRFGYRTKTWDMMRNINLQIHSLVPVYGTLKSVNVFHTGTIPRGGRGVESAKLVESVGGDSLLVGEFVDPGGKPFALVVNKNMKSSVAFGIQFKEKGRIMLISSFNKGRVPFTGEQVWLAPGCGVLLTVE